MNQNPNRNGRPNNASPGAAVILMIVVIVLFPLAIRLLPLLIIGGVIFALALPSLQVKGYFKKPIKPSEIKGLDDVREIFKKEESPPEDSQKKQNNSTNMTNWRKTDQGHWEQTPPPSHPSSPPRSPTAPPLSTRPSAGTGQENNGSYVRPLSRPSQLPDAPSLPQPRPEIPPSPPIRNLVDTLRQVVPPPQTPLGSIQPQPKTPVVPPTPLPTSLSPSPQPAPRQQVTLPVAPIQPKVDDYLATRPAPIAPPVQQRPHQPSWPETQARRDSPRPPQPDNPFGRQERPAVEASRGSFFGGRSIFDTGPKQPYFPQRKNHFGRDDSLPMTSADSFFGQPMENPFSLKGEDPTECIKCLSNPVHYDIHHDSYDPTVRKDPNVE